jgi:uncharacterized membrane protein
MEIWRMKIMTRISKRNKRQIILAVIAALMCTGGGTSIALAANSVTITAGNYTSYLDKYKSIDITTVNENTSYSGNSLTIDYNGDNWANAYGAYNEGTTGNANWNTVTINAGNFEGAMGGSAVGDAEHNKVVFNGGHLSKIYGGFLVRDMRIITV